MGERSAPARAAVCARSASPDVRDGLDLLAEPGVLLQPVALQHAHLILDPLQGARERRERRGELPVLRGRGLQVGDPLTQEIALGDRRPAVRPGGKRGEGGADGDAQEEPHQEGEEGRGAHGAHRGRRYRQTPGRSEHAGVSAGK